MFDASSNNGSANKWMITVRFSWQKVVSILWNVQHFAIDTVTKTIFHESNSMRNGGFNQWQWCMFFAINRIEITRKTLRKQQQSVTISQMPFAGKTRERHTLRWREREREIGKNIGMKSKTLNRFGRKHVFTKLWLLHCVLPTLNCANISFYIDFIGFQIDVCGLWSKMNCVCIWFANVIFEFSTPSRAHAGQALLNNVTFS